MQQCQPGLGDGNDVEAVFGVRVIPSLFSRQSLRDWRLKRDGWGVGGWLLVAKFGSPRHRAGGKPVIDRSVSGWHY